MVSGLGSTWINAIYFTYIELGTSVMNVLNPINQHVYIHAHSWFNQLNVWLVTNEPYQSPNKENGRVTHSFSKWYTLNRQSRQFAQKIPPLRKLYLAQIKPPTDQYSSKKCNSISKRRKKRKEKQVTGHNLEALKTPALELGDGLVGLALPGRAPRLDVVENVNPGGVLGPDGAVLVVAEDVAVHGREVDDGDGERAVHVEDDPSQSRLGGGHGVGRGLVEGASTTSWEEAEWEEGAGEEHDISFDINLSSIRIWPPPIRIHPRALSSPLVCLLVFGCFLVNNINQYPYMGPCISCSRIILRVG